MQRVLALSVLSLAAAAAYAQSQAPTKTRHTASSSAAHSTSAKKNSGRAHLLAANTKTGTRTRAKGKKLRPKPAPSYQLHPDPERYQQIQQALADRGYYKGPINGEWDDDSVDALKRFQGDQKLDSDGKINALSLTGLGLGPKHDGSTGRSAPLPTTSPDNPVAIPPSTSEAQLPQT